MRIIFLLVILVSIVGVLTTGYLVGRQLMAPTSPKFDKIHANREKQCKVMYKTAQTEKDIYGVIVSGSVSSHVVNCNYCKYVIWGAPEYLVKYRADKRALEAKWSREGT